jgi:hypothetical protein
VEATVAVAAACTAQREGARAHAPYPLAPLLQLKLKLCEQITDRGVQPVEGTLGTHGWRELHHAGMVPLLEERGAALQKLNLHGCERVGHATIDAGAWGCARCVRACASGFVRFRARARDFVRAVRACAFVCRACARWRAH